MLVTGYSLLVTRDLLFTYSPAPPLCLPTFSVRVSVSPCVASSLLRFVALLPKTFH